MFRIVVFVEDKKLGETLQALVGLAQGHPEVQPVANADVAPNGKVVARTNGTLPEMLVDHMQRNNLQRIRRSDAGAFLKKHGRSAASATYLLQQSVAAGLLKKHGQSSATVYTVKARKG